MTADIEQIRQRLERFTVLIGESDKLPIWNAEYAVAAQEIAASFYGDDVPALLTALDAANARIAALESVARGLVDRVPIDWDTFADHGNCGYCHKVITWSDCDDVGEHAPDCAWVAARQLVPPGD